VVRDPGVKSSEAEWSPLAHLRSNHDVPVPLAPIEHTADDRQHLVPVRHGQRAVGGHKVVLTVYDDERGFAHGEERGRDRILDDE
jgi:hypothetical protein